MHVSDLDNELTKSFAKLSKLTEQKNKLISLLLETFQPKEKEMADNIRSYWNMIYFDFMDNSEYVSPYAYMKKQLGITYDVSKSPYSVLGYLGIYRHGKERLNYCLPNETKEESERSNQRRLDKYVSLMIQTSINNTRIKLISSALKHFEGMDIKEVFAMEVVVGKGGSLEGTFKVYTSDDEYKILKTQGIYAGGYNIQKFHIRYLSKVI